jgi:hypothetical protein
LAKMVWLASVLTETDSFKENIVSSTFFPPGGVGPVTIRELDRSGRNPAHRDCRLRASFSERPSQDGCQVLQDREVPEEVSLHGLIDQIVLSPAVTGDW